MEYITHFLWIGKFILKVRYRLVFPPCISLPLYFLIKFFLRSWLFDLYSPIFTGIAIGYVNYDLTHYFIHHINFKEGYMKSLKEKHIKHHYIESSYGFAVSNNIWDKVLGTDSYSKNKES